MANQIDLAYVSNLIDAFAEIDLSRLARLEPAPSLDGRKIATNSRSGTNSASAAVRPLELQLVTAEMQRSTLYLEFTSGLS